MAALGRTEAVNALADVVLLGWLPASLVAFALLPIRVAILVAGVGGWLLLPQHAFALPGLPNYEKTNALGLAMLAGCVAFGPQPLLRARPRWLDLPMAAWIASAFLSALANGTGVYDGTSALAYRLLDWGVPYWIGRAYFTSPQHARLLLWAVLAGGLAYVLPALWEIRMSPQLHLRIYGEHQHSWLQTMRGGGYRPMVFLPHGLALALWFAVATIAGAALWRQRPSATVVGVPLGLIAAGLAGTLVLCKSFGALLLMVLGLVLVLAPFGRTLHRALLVAVPAYLLMRLTSLGGVDELLAAWIETLPPDRAESMQFRIDNEAVLIERGWQKPLLGWTPWSFLLPVTDEWGNLQLLVCDSMWIINFVTNGLLGLGAMTTLLLLPAARGLGLGAGRVVRPFDDYPTLAAIVTVFHVDSLVNAFPAPVYLLAMGALVGATATRTVPASRTATTDPVEPAPRGRALAPRGAAGPAALRPRHAGPGWRR